MDIKTLLESKHSKQITMSIVEAVLDKKVGIDEVMQLFFSDHHIICQRAAWPIGIIGEIKPELLNPYVDEMILAANHPKHNAITRNVVRAFQFMHFDDANEGQVYSFCFNLVTNFNQPIAVRCFAFRTCMNIAMIHKELTNEIYSLILILESDDSPAVKNVIGKAKHKLNLD